MLNPAFKLGKHKYTTNLIAQEVYIDIIHIALHLLLAVLIGARHIIVHDELSSSNTTTIASTMVTNATLRGRFIPNTITLDA